MNTVTSIQVVSDLIKKDDQMMNVLRAAEVLNLPDWWIGAGFLRNKVWDYIEGNSSRSPRDIDLVYFDANNTQPETDWAYDEKMAKDYPFAEWEIRNQARMHYVNNLDPFTSTADGIAHWVETATCVAVKLEQGELKYLFCYGTDDLFGLVARPTPFFTSKKMLPIFYSRIEKKQWQARWPNVKVMSV